MSSSLRWILVPVLTLFASVASAEFHTYQIEQIFSDASGNIQFIVMHESMGMSSENFWMGNKLTSTSRLGVTKTFTFSSNLPGVMCGYYTCQGSTAFTRVLIGTQGFRDLGIVNPDYIIPNGFIAIDGGTINYAFVDQVTYSALPTDGVSAIDRGGTSIHNLATNFAGNSASVSALAANYQGLRWVPAGLESGSGLNVAHQGDTIFATWFTYDTSGKEWWLSMTANKSASNPDTYTGQLVQTHGPAFSAVPFDPTQVTRSVVGNGTLTFTDVNNGSFAYSVTTAASIQAQALTQQVKTLTRQTFGTLPACSFSAQANPVATTNYQDLWWAAGGSESGWGLNLTHQAATIFATWFTYDTDGTPLWLSATLSKGVGESFSGALLKTAGPAFNAVPFDPNAVTRSTVGSATLSFSDGNTGAFDYTVNTVTQHKAIMRQLFNPPGGTVCH